MNLLLEKLYNQPTRSITIPTASYPFITLTAIAKITSVSKGPIVK
jgi:hypothetical protein